MTINQDFINDFNKLPFKELLNKYPKEFKPKDEINPITKKFYDFSNKLKSQKLNFGCLYNGCTEQPINSHSIQEAQLRNIADSTNHVISFESSFNKDTRPEPNYKKVGVDLATGSPLLCINHDNSLFQNIEIQPINTTRKNVFLFTFRSVLREYYTKRHIYELSKKTFGSDLMYKLLIKRSKIEFEYIEKIKDIFENALLKNDFDIIDFGVRKFKAKTPILLTSTFSSKNNDKKEPEYLSLSIVNSNNKGLVIYSVLKNQQKMNKNIIQNLEKLQDKELEIFLSELILKNIENFVISPDLWNYFSQKKKDSILDYFNKSINNGSTYFDLKLNNLFRN